MTYKTEEYVVAFLDVLGATKEIQKDSDGSLNIVHNVYNNALRSCEELYDDEEIKGLKPIVRIFSDNIVIAVPTKGNTVFSAFVSVVILCGLIQHEFLQYRCLVRGGIATGDFFADETMIWGNALLNAYYTENKISIYPRIVIHPATTKKLSLAIEELKEKWVAEDADGLVFVDYMREMSFASKFNFVELIHHRLHECEKMLEQAGDDIKVGQKIRWHKTYLLSKIDICSLDYSEILSREIRKLEAKTREVEQRRHHNR